MSSQSIDTSPGGNSPDLHFLVVIGTSAGGTEALASLLGQLPEGFPCCVLIVRHISHTSSVQDLVNELNLHSRLPCLPAGDGDPVLPGRVYLAPAGSQLLAGPVSLSLAHGARENRWQPAIDPLFRSAAVHYPGRTIGVILTGYLDDGTVGLSAIKRCGGVCVVQDPADAVFPDMPRNALAKVEVDYCVPLAKMGSLLRELAARVPPAGPEVPEVPEDLMIEARISERMLMGPRRVDELGERTIQTCPDCGGILWETEKGVRHFRCHTGHVFSEGALLQAQREKIEETLWVALRMFEERRSLLQGIALKGGAFDLESLDERICQAELHIERIREIFGESSRNAAAG